MDNNRRILAEGVEVDVAFQNETAADTPDGTGYDATMPDLGDADTGDHAIFPLEVRTEDPEIGSVIRLHGALAAARKNPSNVDAKRDLAGAWAEIYSVMPDTPSVGAVEPDTPPITDVGMEHLGEKLQALDVELRQPLGKILALAMAATHPDALPLGETADIAMGRITEALASSYERLVSLQEQSKFKTL